MSQCIQTAKRGAVDSTLVDSLRVHGTALIRTYHVFQDSVRVSLLALDTLPIRLVGEPPWKEPLAMFFQAAIALGSAWLGAWYGGKKATEATLRAHKLEQETRDKRERQQLRNRITYNLKSFIALTDVLKDWNPSIEIGKELMQGMEQLWSTYDRLSDLSIHFKSEDYRLKVEAFFDTIRQEADVTMGMEERYVVDLAAQAILPHQVTQFRWVALQRILAMREKAEHLQAELDAELPTP